MFFYIILIAAIILLGIPIYFLLGRMARAAAKYFFDKSDSLTRQFTPDYCEDEVDVIIKLHEEWFIKIVWPVYFLIGALNLLATFPFIGLIMGFRKLKSFCIAITKICWG